MPRYKLTIEYDGTDYAGWQRQPHAPSIQASLEQAIFKFSAEQVTLRGAGRTDAGVHALAQVAHFDLATHHTADTVRDALNFHIKPAPIAILNAAIVPLDFDARFSALKRHYLYRIQNRRAPVALLRGRAWWVPHPLSVDAMQEAAQLLVGQHDFTTFRAAECQAKSPVKTVSAFQVSRMQNDEIHLHVSAPSFLHNQVRSFVGSLKLVGAGRWTRQDLKTALQAKSRAACGPVAPAHGLYLKQIDYEPGK